MNIPKIERIKEANSDPNKAMVIIRGYLSEEESSDFYVKKLKDLGWKGAIYGMVWDAGDISSYIKITFDAIRTLSSFSTVKLASKLVKIIVHWNKTNNRAQISGEKYMISLLKEEIKESEISIITHSLGTRVCFYGLNTIKDGQIKIKECIFMGGAISGEIEEWGKIATELNCKIYNVFNEWDWVLQTFYKPGSFTLTNPCGLKGIKIKHPNIINISVTDIVGKSYDNHFQYIEVSDKTMLKSLWN